MPPIQDIPDLPPNPENALFLNQLESLMRREFVGDVPAASFSDELEATMKHEFFADLPAAVEVNENHVVDIASKSFSYKPVVGKEEIRVLRLEPGKTGGLKGELVHVQLNDNPAYEALSYAWGPPVKPYAITLPNGNLRITESLFTGLIRLRRRGKSRLLWIDQLCINQDDNMEKSQQILLMSRIYSLASRVLVWLGEDEGNGSIALRLLEEIGKMDTSNLPERLVSRAWMRENGLPASGERAWYALLNFWRRPWFRRAWVVQEFVLAKDALMICGDAQLSWKAFTSAHEKMTQYSLLDWGTFEDLDIQEQKKEAFSGAMMFRFMMETKHVSKLGPSIANVIRSFSERDTGLEELHIGSWSRIPGVREMVMMLRQMPAEATGPITQMIGQLIESFTSESAGFRLPLCHLLMMFCKSEATNPRDRLFAFLGLAKDGDDSSLRPNYDESVELVFLRYAKHFVRNGDGMKLLYEAAGVSNREISIPSWAPDWTKTDALEKRLINLTTVTGSLYKAAADTAPRIRLADDEREIVISGGYVDRVSRTAVHYSWDLDADRSYGLIPRLRNFFKEVDSFFNREPYVTGEPLFEVEWKTLIGNTSGEITLTIPEEYGQQYRDCRQMIEDLSTEGPSPRLFDETNSYLKQLLPIIICYKLCETESGLVGMMPLDTMLGDSVYIFTGGALPFILRPVVGFQSKYKVIGGCYIHGIMDGEVVRSDKWREEDVTLQ
jgi:hypothetical protein